jgi:cobalt-zinc-cadmium efflux system protein
MTNTPPQASGHHDHSNHDHSHGHHHGHEHHHDHAHTAHAGHSHGHGHSHGGDRLGVAFWLIGGFTIVEAIGGWWSGSLTLLADAGHLFVDTLALALAFGAQRLAQRPASTKRSFGHGRVGVLAAFVNSLVLLGIVVAIVVEAGFRLADPHPMNAGIALWVASGGIAVNLLVAALLHGHHHGDMNVRAAYLHVLSDLLGAVAAAAAALIVMGTGWLAADAWLSLIVTLLIGRSAWPLLVHSAHVLQEGTPEGFDAERLAQRLVSVVPGVVDVHHVHAWSLTPSEPLLTLHATLAPNADAGEALRAIKALTVAEFGIRHSTIQLEPAACADPDHACGEPAASLASR